MLAEYDDAHGYQHARRVAKLADRIREKDGGDREIILASGYMHHWGLHLGMGNQTSKEALAEIEADLKGLKFPENKIAPVIFAIKYHTQHDVSAGVKHSFSENGLILQDADGLDAIGAVGSARCFYTTAVLGKPMEEALEYFDTRLVNRRGYMNTGEGHRLAQRGHTVLEEFLKRVKDEWDSDAPGAMAIAKHFYALGKNSEPLQVPENTQSDPYMAEFINRFERELVGEL